MVYVHSYYSVFCETQQEPYLSGVMLIYVSTSILKPIIYKYNFLY